MTEPSPESTGSARVFTPPREDPRLNPARKTVYASGDFTVNTALVALSMIYVSYFLTQVAGMRPELAGAVQLIARAVDAFTDPAMGRISDLCRWKLGRRRPFFLLGAVPLGISFALLWSDTTGWSQGQMFAYYTAVYVVLSLSLTCVSVPYLALQPEMAIGYDARTSLNTYRNAGSIVGVLAAVTFPSVAGALGGGPAGYALAGVAFGVLLALPWFAIFGATWERPEFQSRSASMSFLDGARLVAKHHAFRRLTGMYLCGRVAMDLVGAMLILYFTHWMGRSGDFQIMMMVFMGSVLFWLPIWLRLSMRMEKSTTFVIGTSIWIVGQMVFLFATPGWPPWTIFLFAPLTASGYALVDLMPWSMLGEVVDEDDLANGERREGVYNGFFMFLRKLAGTVAVFLAMTLLGLLGFTKGDEQPEAAVTAIRWMTSIGPCVFLAASIWFARAYPLTRLEHGRILDALAARDQGGEATRP
ncbi:MAG: MFS transporter [Myxococcota bacterium]